MFPSRHHAEHCFTLTILASSKPPIPLHSLAPCLHESLGPRHRHHHSCNHLCLPTAAYWVPIGVSACLPLPTSAYLRTRSLDFRENCQQDRAETLYRAACLHAQRCDWCAQCAFFVLRRVFTLQCSISSVYRHPQRVACCEAGSGYLR